MCVVSGNKLTSPMLFANPAGPARHAPQTSSTMGALRG
jgi:hypothetical protein